MNIINYTNCRFNEKHILCKKKKVKLKAEIVAVDSEAIIKAEATLLLVEFYILVNIFNKTIKHWRLFFFKTNP